MAQTNGHVEAEERAGSPVQHLGKRKRTVSPDPKPKQKVALVQQSLENALQLIRRHDASATILKYPLTGRGEDRRTTKRQRTASTTPTPDLENDNIERRVLDGDYQSFDDLMEDMTNIKSAILGETLAVNGTSNSHAAAKEQISIIWETLFKYQNKINSTQIGKDTSDETDTKSTIPTLPTSLVLSLRSQTEHGIRQLFSGLPNDGEPKDIDGRRLPNGFEVAELSHSNQIMPDTTDPRKFREVFGQHPRTKPLDMPRSRHVEQGSALDFIPAYENIPVANRNDHKYASLKTGFWLKYATSDKVQSDSKEKAKNESRESALFKSAFSSFAPTVDNSAAAVTDHARSQQWWRKHNNARDEYLFATRAEQNPETPLEVTQIEFDKDFEEVVANFIPESDHTPEVDDLLNDVSELIETLSSYQANRDFEIAKGPTSASKPTQEEQDIYELLRSQLQLLVNSLPPFAVAKLHGDQLEALNISTQVLSAAPEFVGTAQIDDYTLRRTRAAQAAASAVGRSAGPVQARPSYGTPTAAYNAQARAYNNNVTGTAYAARPPTAMYNTLRPGAHQATPYGQPAYRPGGVNIHTPSIQQFQRPMTNGYGPTGTPTAPTPYLQRPSQPGYQQRAQDSGAQHRADSPQKPLVNGQSQQFQARPYVPPINSYSATTPDTPSQSRAVPDAAKQRGESGTPQPPGQSSGGVPNASQQSMAIAGTAT